MKKQIQKYFWRHRKKNGEKKRTEKGNEYQLKGENKEMWEQTNTYTQKQTHAQKRK